MRHYKTKIQNQSRFRTENIKEEKKLVTKEKNER